jgi:hypothetical protein
MTSDRSTTTNAAVNENATAEGSALDLADLVRSLSIGSDASSFSVISRTSTANSFDSVRSLNSDQSHEDEEFSASPRPQSHADTSDSIDLQHSVLSLNTVKSLLILLQTTAMLSRRVSRGSRTKTQRGTSSPTLCTDHLHPSSLNSSG